MGKFIFVKGKNPELSRIELVSYLESRDIDYSIVVDSKQFIVIEADIDKKMIEFLGGMLKIAKVVNETRKLESKSFIGLEAMIKKKVFGLSVYAEKDEHNIYKNVGKILKKNLKQAGL